MISWRSMKTCPRRKEDEKHDVLVWHVWQMCMVYDCEKARDNRFIVRWQEIPEAWIPIAERKPTFRDANVLGVVIVKDKYGTVRLRGWHNACGESGVTHWMRTPDAPDNYLELREAAEKPFAERMKKK